MKSYKDILRNVSVLIFMSMTINAHAQVDTTFDLYFLIGQSNMAGRGEITAEYQQQGNPRILMLDKENNWVQAKHPLHFDKPTIAGVGPGLSFALEMSKNNGGHKIGLIPCAVGGTSINTWTPGGFDKSTNTHPWNDALIRLKKAMETGVLKGVIWLQGEADSDSTKSLSYLAKLEELISLLRKTTNNPALPFVAGELGRYKEQYNNINRVLALLPGKVKYTAVASSEGFKDKGDLTHFDSPSADEYGRRFAIEMKKLQQTIRK